MMFNQQHFSKYSPETELPANHFKSAAGGFSLEDNRTKRMVQRKAVENQHHDLTGCSNGFPIQRKIKIGSEEKNIEYGSASQMKDLLEAIKKEVDAPEIGKVKLQQGNLAKLIKEDAVHSFDTHKALYDHLAFPIVPVVSQYVGEKGLNVQKNANSMELFRAMSTAEASDLKSSKKFGMYINKKHEESGIKFFATDINYSIGLSNTKNVEAHNKREKVMPYTDMFAAVVDKRELFHGLKKDIGIHDDKEHTSNFLSTEPASSSVVKDSERTESQFREIVKAQGQEKDTEGHGYVLKHENGGLNFGVKAKSEINTKPHWKSPVDYFTSLVKACRFIGHFNVVPKDDQQQ